MLCSVQPQLHSKKRKAENDTFEKALMTTKKKGKSETDEEGLPMLGTVATKGSSYQKIKVPSDGYKGLPSGAPEHSKLQKPAHSAKPKDSPEQEREQKKERLEARTSPVPKKKSSPSKLHPYLLTAAYKASTHACREMRQRALSSLRESRLVFWSTFCFSHAEGVGNRSIFA